MHKIRVLILVASALIALILLAAALPGLEFRPVQHFVVGERGSASAEQVQTIQPLSPIMRVAPAAGLSVGYTVMLVLLPAAILYLTLSPKARREILPRLLPFLFLGALLLLLRQHPEVLHPETEQVSTVFGTPAPPAGPAVQFDATPPSWVRWLVTVSVAVALVLGAGAAAWIYRRRHMHDRGPLERLATEAQAALDALGAGADLRETILRCYFEMSRVLSEERGLTRQQTMTPREFEARLTLAGLPQAPVRRLTRLFEQVRYGAKSAAPGEQQEALECLAEVVAACRKSGHEPADSRERVEELGGLAEGD